MKTKDLASNYGLNHAAFDEWIKLSTYRHKVGFMGGVEIDDDKNLKEVVEAFRRNYAEQQEEMTRARAEQERTAGEKRQALAGILITSGFNFDGYTITKYSGYISGDDAVQIDRGTAGFFSNATDVGAGLMKSLVIIRRNALAELKEAAYDLGCNAVIGVDFDYLTLDPETASSSGGTMYLPYVFGVTANGNAVIIEKNTVSRGNEPSLSQLGT